MEPTKDIDPLEEMEKLVLKAVGDKGQVVKMPTMDFFQYVEQAKRERGNLINRLDKIRLMLSAHPDCIEHSEFHDQVDHIDDLIGPDDQNKPWSYAEDGNGFQVCVNCGRTGRNCSDGK